MKNHENQGECIEFIDVFSYLKKKLFGGSGWADGWTGFQKTAEETGDFSKGQVMPGSLMIFVPFKTNPKQKTTQKNQQHLKLSD